MPNSTINSIKELIDGGMYAGFAALVHYLYVYQAGKIAFSVVGMITAIVIGLFIGNVVTHSVPEDYVYKILFLEINKTTISFFAGFASKFLLDSFEQYQGAIFKKIYAFKKLK